MVKFYSRTACRSFKSASGSVNSSGRKFRKARVIRDNVCIHAYKMTGDAIIQMTNLADGTPYNYCTICKKPIE